MIAWRRYLSTGDPADLDRQVHHLNRSLGQLTGRNCPQGELLCPRPITWNTGVTYLTTTCHCSGPRQICDWR
jgi:hypothetical protein